MAAVPVYPGVAQVENSDKVQDGKRFRNRTLITPDNAVRVEAFYLAELVKNGWRPPEITRDVSSRKIVILETHQPPHRSLEITIVPGKAPPPLIIYEALEEE